MAIALRPRDARTVVRVRVKKRTKSQRELTEWRAPEGTTMATTGMMSAGYGSAKSTGVVMRFALVVMMRPPWDPESGEQQPLALAIAPTYPVLRNNLVPMLQTWIPREVIRHATVGPPAEWTLANGVKILFISGEATVDAVTAFAALVDEAGYPLFLQPAKWAKITSRLRAPGYRELTASGIAVDDPALRERFYDEAPDRKMLYPGILENPGLDEAARNTILAATPYHMREAVLHGGIVPSLDTYYRIDRTVHEWDATIDKQLPAYVGLDPGKSSAAGVYFLLDGVLIQVDEVITWGDHSEKLLLEVKARGYAVQTVAVDTQASLDTLAAIRRVFPAARIWQHPKRSKEWLVREGIERVQWALGDAHGRVRLKFHSDLWDQDNPRNFVNSLARYRRHPETGKPVRDDTIDHQCDVTRYVVQTLLTPSLPGREKDPDPDPPDKPPEPQDDNDGWLSQKIAALKRRRPRV